MADGEHTTRCCGQCGIEKPATDFYRRTNGTLRRECKSCRLQSQAQYVRRNADAVSSYKKRWNLENHARLSEAKREKYQQDSQRAKERAAQYAKAHPERVKSYKKKWKQDNPQAVREYTFLRTRTKRIATPRWANRAAMLSLYRAARELTKSTGVEHHVDHIVPLRSLAVCGLHCEQNMQVLDAFSNQSKLNRWWPDMWEPL